MSRILIWDIERREKNIIIELPQTTSSLYTTQWISDATWSPGGQYVSFIIHERYNAFNHLKLIDIDTMKTIHLGEDVYTYKWSPDGKHIAYRTDHYPHKLIVVDLSGKREFHTEDKFSSISSYSWSPDGNKIIFYALDENEKPGAYLIKIKRKKLKKLFEFPNMNRFLSDVS